MQPAPRTLAVLVLLASGCAAPLVHQEDGARTLRLAATGDLSRQAGAEGAWTFEGWTPGSFELNPQGRYAWVLHDRLAPGALRATRGSPVRVLRLPCFEATDADLEALRELTQLEGLTLEHAVDLTTAALDHLRPLSQLEVLTITDADWLTDADLRRLRPLRGLRELWLHGAHGLEGADLSALGDLSSLEVLDLTGCLGLRNLTGIERCRRLEELILEDCRFLQPEALEALARLPRLERLNLSGWSIRPPGALGFLAGLRSLRELELRGAPHVAAPLDDDVTVLRPLRRLRLRRLELGYHEQLAGLQVLRDFQHLRELGLESVQLRRSDVAVLGTLSQLERLAYQPREGSPQPSLPHLRELAPYLGLPGPGALAAFPGLEGLEVGSLDDLPPLLPALGSLRRLHVRQGALDAATLAALVAACPGLEELEARVGPELSALADLEGLRRIDLRIVGEVTPRELVELVSHPALDEGSVRWNAAAREEVEAVRRAAPPGLVCAGRWPQERPGPVRFVGGVETSPPPESERARALFVAEQPPGGELRALRVGKYVAWDGRGRRIQEGAYRDGRKHGLWRLREPSGWREERWEDGVRVE